ncbi:MAG: heavy metal-associated domain-containing protein [Bacteroidota bacterium]
MKLTILLLASLIGFSFAPQEQAPLDGERIERAVIKTTAICGMCKVRIEGKVKELEGVVSASLDLVSRKLRVRYDADLLSLDMIREAIASVGYKADDVPANREAFDALPGCCRTEGACSSGR